MARHGKPDKTGRSSGKIQGKKMREWRNPPKDEPWGWLPRSLMESDAWRGRSVHCARLIDFLMLDYMDNAGLENGRLMATYDQLAAFGISRRKINGAIKEAEQRGLVRARHGGRWNMTNRPSLFRLTFYADHTGAPASNEWKRYRSPKKQNHATEKDTTVVPHGGTTGADDADTAPTQAAENRRSAVKPVVPHGGTASISSLVRAAGRTA